MWIPGNEWAPAWVSWRQSPDYYGWAPLGPSVSINVATGGGYNPPPHYWSFVPQQYVTSPHVNNYYVSEQQNVTIINNTTVIHNTTIVNNTVNNTTIVNNNVTNNHVTVNNYAGGPDPAQVSRVTGTPLRPVPLRESNTPDEALAAAGVDRGQVYVTNAVKHFKFEPRGKFRLHKTPETPEINACRWWLDKELQTVSAPLVVAMGATAVFALTGKRAKLKDVRGQAQPFGEGRRLFVTVHPAFVLRVPDREVARIERERFFADIAAAARLLQEAA